MARVLLVGYDPETVDLTDPALPPGMSAEKVYVGIEVALTVAIRLPLSRSSPAI